MICCTTVHGRRIARILHVSSRNELARYLCEVLRR
jgi:hypothetical protein